MQRILAAAVLLITVFAIPMLQAGENGHSADDLRSLAISAVSEDAAIAQAAIKSLRQSGPDGLEALFAVHAEQIKQHAAAASESTATPQATATLRGGRTARVAIALEIPANGTIKIDPAWQRLRNALDAVGGQRDCHASRLYWYTDLEEAKAAARREHKPILSLRLLGNLTDEFSCANSRFFRTALYANPEIGRMLRERFVLHWKSVRPAPRITIDFGDGRKLERTVTGNSIHYVLDSEGRLIDALPGLYGAKPFARELKRADEAAQQSETAVDRQRFLVDYHRDRSDAILAAWQDDLQRLRIDVASSSSEEQSTAMANRLSAATDDRIWNRLAQLHDQECALDPASVALIASQTPTAAQAAPLAISKSIVEKPLVALIRNFQGAIALDTVRNEYLFHQQIHVMLAAGPDANVDAFNELVYAQLFLTPSSDPWLGLKPQGVYSGLENDGATEPSPGAKTAATARESVRHKSGS